MSTPQYPNVELIQRNEITDHGTPARRRRWKVFIVTLVVALLVGLSFVYGRTPVYRASVSLLTVKPKAVDMPSAEADVQHVAIQTRLLLGEEILGRLSRRLKESGDARAADQNYLRNILSVAATADTNLLELRAQGEEPSLLQRIVNDWAKSFHTFRLEEIQDATSRTSAELIDEQRQLNERIEAARTELLAFRQAHDIVSLKRDENRKIAGLRGLNNSLNKARERLVVESARKAAIDDAIAQGETVVPNEQKAAIAQMRVNAARASAKLSALRQKYTEVYLSRDPAFRDLPAAVEEMQQELAAALQVAKATVRDEAQQEVGAARTSVEALERQLNSDQKSVQLFTERFKQFKTLEEGLAQLERLSAERAERLAKIAVRNQEKFPPIQIVEWARLPDRPISPDYERDLAIALAAALGLALFVTWLVEYLSERPQAGTQLPILGMRISHSGPDALLTADDAGRQLPASSVPSGRLSDARAFTTDQPEREPIVPRELSATELEVLLQRLDRHTTAHMTLLLSGVAPHELSLLTPASFDSQARRVSVGWKEHREFTLHAASWQRIEPLLESTQEVSLLSIPELDTRLASAAREAGVQDPNSVKAAALWSTYVIYLVRQGIDHESLIARVGTIPAEIDSALAGLAQPAANQALGSIEYTHPSLTHTTLG